MKWLLVLLSLPCFAQIQSAKFHYGDDLRWADPNFDDSAWIDVDSPTDIYAHLLETVSWARLKVRMPDRATRPVVGTATPVLEVYAQGLLIGSSGSLPPDFRDAKSSYRVWPIPPDMAQAGQIITVAVRLWRAPGLDLRRNNPRTLSGQYQVFVHPAGETPIYDRRQTSNLRGQMWALAIVLMLLLFLLTAGRVEWTQEEFRSIIFYTLLVLAIHVAYVSSWILPWGNRSFAVTASFQAMAAVTQLELIAWTAGVRRTWWLRAVQGFGLSVSLLIACANLMTQAPSWLPFIARTYAGAYALNLLASIIILLLQKSHGVAGRFFPLGLVAASAGTAGTRFLPGLGLPGGFYVADVFFASLVAGNILFAVVLVAVRLRRLRDAGQVSVKLQAQFEAARGVQEMLLTGNAPATPGYRIEPVYYPAEEVGGDFFRILPAPNNCTLLVVGDVSGKGLKAAMLVSVIVGALLNRRSSEPAIVLAELNDAIHGQMEGGFVTCCAALFMPGGVVKLANAGHLPPYCNSIEVELPAALPLGIVPHTEYATVEFRLHSDTKLTFFSDGVVEAENSHGELFGFDRAREASGRTAVEIARTAKAFGQNDDITVLTVERLSMVSL